MFANFLIIFVSSTVINAGLSHKPLWKINIVLSNLAYVGLDCAFILQCCSVCGMQTSCEGQYVAALYAPTPSVVEVSNAF